MSESPSAEPAPADASVLAAVAEPATWHAPPARAVRLHAFVIALAWVVYRPLIGIALLVVAGGIIYWFGWGRKRKPAPAAA